MWMKPVDKPQESTGSQENVWVLNGHFVKGDYQGMMNGQPFVGTGYWGYDMVRQEYQSLWLDGMGTGRMYAPATYDASKKTLSMTGTMSGRITGDTNTRH